MGRPLKDGIDYFPIDLDIMGEDSVAFVDAKYGVQAFGLLVRLLIRIYRKGYYIGWTEKDQYLFARSINLDVNLTREIVSAYINEGFFDNNLYKCYGIITSRGLQKRYIKACERRSKVMIIQEYFLLNLATDASKDLKLDNVTLMPLIATITPINSTLSTPTEEDAQQKPGFPSTLSTQSKLKESRVEESRTTTPLPPVETDEEKTGNKETETRVVVIDLLTKNICMVSKQVDVDMINDWIETMPRDWIVEAIKLAKSQKAHYVRYVDTILQAWVSKYKLDDKPWEVEANGRHRQNGLSGGHRRDPTPDEYERDRSTPGWGDGEGT